MMKEYSDTEKLPDVNPLFTEEGIAVVGNINTNNLKDALDEFLEKNLVNLMLQSRHT